ncbi:MAG: prolyl oligopeptidase family serine peptidase [Eubacteriales bacterium]|nr:prolyl oligopeptidase family serine peptidase [Eubacteriales bacterium]
MEKKKLDFENLRDVVWISEPALSPDGTRAAYVKGISDYDSGQVKTRILEKNLETGEVWEAALSRMVQKNPVYSPDGKKLAFLASDGRPWQVWVKKQGEEPVQATHLRHGAANPVFSPDGGKLAFEMKYFPWEDAELFREMTVEEYEAFRKAREEEPKVIENLIYKLDEAYGMLDGSRTGIGVLTLETMACERVTPADVSYGVPSFLDGGKCVACYGYPHTHCKEMSAEIYRIELETGAVRQIERSVPSYYGLPIQEDAEGNFLYCGVHMDRGAAMPEIFRVAPEGGESALLFATDPVCHGIDPLLSGDAHLPQKDCAFRQDGEGKLYFLSYHMGRSNVFCWDGEKISQMTEEACVLSFDGPVDGKMLVLKAEWNEPAELYLLRQNEAGRFVEECRVTRSNEWLEEYEMFEPVPVSVRSRDGKAEIRGWVMVPESAERQGRAENPGASEGADRVQAPESAEGQSQAQRSEAAEKQNQAGAKPQPQSPQIPAVLDIHGGPESCYAAGFFYEAQMMASKGMAVLFCDPRGASGYGPEFMQDAYAYGQEAVDDYLEFVEEACRRFPQIDRKRVGVTGGSYGGHMTNKLISVTDAFAAAVTQRTWVNPSTSYGTGDMGFYSAAPQTVSFQEYMENRARNSIMKYVRNIHVPLLILHGEKDYRCALEQGEQVYHALRSLKPELPVKIVIFPGENHAVTRAGLLHNQIRHMKEMTEWFETYLGEEAGRNA